MRIVLVGARGQLGTDLQACLGDDVVSLGHEQIEITDAGSVEAALADARPEVVINAAAYNLVDRAEEEPDVAHTVNALGPRNLALWCAKHDVALLHVSTDYVFSGRLRVAGLDIARPMPYLETDTPEPLSAYGVSKLAGEYYVRSLCRRHFVVRTCGLYGRSGARGKGNFVETMLRLGRERDELRVVDDQSCTPTATADVARAIAALLETRAYGVYHATNSGNATWYEFAREIFRLARIDVDVHPITSAEFGARAQRPVYSVLDNRKLGALVGFELPPWPEALARYLAEKESS